MSEKVIFAALYLFYGWFGSIFRYANKSGLPLGCWLLPFGSTVTKTADCVESQIAAACELLAANPQIGHSRQDLTLMPVRFWTIPRLLNYVIVYNPASLPLQIIRIFHGALDISSHLASS